MSFPGTPEGVRAASHFITTLAPSILIYLKNFTRSATLSIRHMTRISFNIFVLRRGQGKRGKKDIHFYFLSFILFNEELEYECNSRMMLQF